MSVQVHDTPRWLHRTDAAGSPTAIKRTNRRSVRYRLLGILLLAVLTGCQATEGIRNQLDYSDACNDLIVGWRNRVWSNQAWHEHQELAADQRFPNDFEAGFLDGYAAAGEGGDGCPPPLPPRKYWSWKYQTPEGQGKVAAWYAGWPHGARAAEEDGAASWSQIQVSQQIEQQYAPPYTRTNRNSSSVLAPTAAGTAPSTEPVPAAPTSDGATLLRLPQPTTRQSPAQPRPSVPPRFAAR